MVEVEVDCLVLFFVGLAGYSLWDILFVGVPQGR
jgi:hypothetical protein